MRNTPESAGGKSKVRVNRGGCSTALPDRAVKGGGRFYTRFKKAFLTIPNTPVELTPSVRQFGLKLKAQTGAKLLPALSNERKASQASRGCQIRLHFEKLPCKAKLSRSLFVLFRFVFVHLSRGRRRGVIPKSSKDWASSGKCQPDQDFSVFPERGLGNHRKLPRQEKAFA